jgi:opacity protein-like surface antigen
MRKILIAAVLAAIAMPAFAQQPMAPAKRDTNTPAINTPNSPNNAGAPVSGANSFTEAQAKSRIEAKGFSGVSGLKKDNAGVWRGTAKQGAKAVNVSIDFQGNVVTN